MKINIFRNSSMYYWSCPPFNKKWSDIQRNK
jgi:hypothetical protein